MTRSSTGAGAATADAEDVSLPDGIAVVCLLHYGLGGAVLLLGLAAFGARPVLGAALAVIGALLVYFGHGLRDFRRSVWRRTIAFHGVDIGVGLLLLASGGIGDHLVSVALSGAVVGYLYLRRDLYRDETG